MCGYGNAPDEAEIREWIESLSREDLFHLALHSHSAEQRHNFARLWEADVLREVFDYRLMKAEAKALREDPDTCDRYANATRGAREWMCLSRWMARNPEAESDRRFVEYRDMLTAWVTAREWCYVLDFECERPQVTFIIGNLLAAIRRENTDLRLAWRKTFLAMGAREWRLQRENGSMMGRAAAKGLILRLQGKDPGASWFTHRDYGAYCTWWNRYVHPIAYHPMKLVRTLDAIQKATEERKEK